MTNPVFAAAAASLRDHANSLNDVWARIQGELDRVESIVPATNAAQQKLDILKTNQAGLEVSLAQEAAKLTALQQQVAAEEAKANSLLAEAQTEANGIVNSGHAQKAKIVDEARAEAKKHKESAAEELAEITSKVIAKQAELAAHQNSLEQTRAKIESLKEAAKVFAGAV